MGRDEVEPFSLKIYSTGNVDNKQAAVGSLFCCTPSMGVIYTVKVRNGGWRAPTIAKDKGAKFLGFSFLPNRQATIRLAPKTIETFKDKVRELTSHPKSMSLDKRIGNLNRYLMRRSACPYNSEESKKILKKYYK